MAFAPAMPLNSCGEWLHRVVGANGQPAVASYLRRNATGEFCAWSFDVLTVHGDPIASVTSFLGEEHVGALGSPCL